MLSSIFVESCPACDGPTPSGFCSVCSGEFEPVGDVCLRCGLSLPVVHCPARRAPWRVDAVVAPLRYAAPLDHYLHALKYRGARSLGRAFALLIAGSVRGAAIGLDALVAVPLHRSRMLSRGYNQAHEIARTLARQLALPLVASGITRHRAGEAQALQGVLQRRTSVAHAFRVTCDLKGLRVAIVDDVVTTGATVNALATQLRAAGAATCIAIAVARTPERAASGTERVIEHDPGEHRAAEPGVVQKRAEREHDVAVSYQKRLICAEERRSSQADVVPGAELSAAPDEHEADEQQRL
jgi:ComF family protein